jgi:hypothetical protein
MRAKEARASNAGTELKCTIPQIGRRGKASGRRTLVVGVVASILVLAVGGVWRLGQSARSRGPGGHKL